MKKAFLLTAIFAALLGTVQHFFFDWLPNPLTALIAPVNESVWEHLKLLYFPTLLGGFFLAHRVKEKNRLWSGIFIAVLAMPVLLLGVYYLLRCGFNAVSTFADIALYYVISAVGWLLAYRIFRSGRAEKAAPWLLLPVMLYGAALILFTFAAPEFPVFRAPDA